LRTSARALQTHLKAFATLERAHFQSASKARDSAVIACLGVLFQRTVIPLDKPPTNQISSDFVSVVQRQLVELGTKKNPQMICGAQKHVVKIW
jgi:hypothetical protein